MSDVVERAKAALEGVTDGPWKHCTAPHEYDDALPVATVDKAKWLADTLIGDGEPLHVLITDSPDPKFAYTVPALTGDGPTSERNAQFIAQARTLVPELVAEVERVKSAAKTLGEIIESQCRMALDATGLHHLIDETGDGDWGAVWENLLEMRSELEKGGK